MTNVFRWEPQKTTLFFLTQGGHLSGDLLKSLEYRAPQIVKEMQEELAKDNTIGRYFELRGGIYGFLVVRKHYNSKPDAGQFASMLRSLPARTFKTTLETHEVYAKVLKELALPTIEIYNTSLWGKGE